MRVNKNLLRDIDRNVNLLRSKREDSVYFLRLSNVKKSQIETLAAQHSVALEDPVHSRLALKKGPRSKSRKILRRGKKVIEKSWREARAASDIFDPAVLQRVNCVIQSDGNCESDEISPYRNKRVSLGLPKLTPPNPVKVPELMGCFYRRLKEYMDREDVHPVEVAIEAHFGIATIQPFIDGNKRSARILEAVILGKGELPVGVLPYGERSNYLNLLDEAGFNASGYNDRALPVDFKTYFADYLASKVNVSLERMLGRKS
tara:strand:+ start:13885 stop:14664 length:780 start_codon:yes stop_codon:yes gene_type:complete